jgi:curved DNA-binding protein
LYTAVLGGELTVNTFDGKVKLKVTEGTPNDTKVKLKGKDSQFIKKRVSLVIFTSTIKFKFKTSPKKELFTQLANLQNHDCSKLISVDTLCSLPSIMITFLVL